MISHIEVMISSTARDLPDHRHEAMNACIQNGLHPVMMEHLPALDADAIDASLKMVKDALLYVGIFAFRYGYVPTDPKNPSQLSITELEYDCAVQENKPRLIFVATDDHYPLLEREEEPGATRLAHFRERVLNDRVVKFFHSPEELGRFVSQALAHWKLVQNTWQPTFPSDLGTLPKPSKLPPGSRILLSRNPFFTGREDDLKKISELLLTQPDSKVVITPAAAATGAGGIGKTQLAIEFAYRYGRYFYGVHWLDMFGAQNETVKSRFETEVAACGREMGLPDFPDEQPEQVRATLVAWLKTTPRLVILDNAASPQVVQDVLSRLHGVCLLVTSRWVEDIDWQSLGIEPCGLDILGRSQSIELLRKLAPHLKDVSELEIDRLAERLGDFPLALDLAGRYLGSMHQLGLSVGEYLYHLDETSNLLDHTSLREWAAQARRINPTKHDTDVAATFRLSWNRVDNSLAQELFRAGGYLAPNRPIPVELLKRLEDGERKVSEVALKQLMSYGLLTHDPADPEKLTIHPLLTAFARKLDEEANTSMLSKLSDALEEATTEAGETGLPALFAPLRPHLEVAAEYAEKAALEKAATLWNNLGYHLDAIADLDGALAAYKRAVHIGETVHGPDDPIVASRVSNMGTVLRALGDLTGARSAFERALRIEEAVYGPDHPEVAIDLNNLGTVLRALGELDSARSLLERALHIEEVANGPEHPNVATAVNNLGQVLQDLGDLKGAQAAYKRAMHISEKVYGPEHPNIAIRVNNLGTVLYETGDFNGAQVAFERALHIYEAVYGPDHPEVATQLNNLGLVFRALGELDRAQDVFKQALQISEALYGSDHPRVATVLCNLGRVLRDLGALDEARVAIESALRIDEVVYGPDHPEVATDVSILGMILHDLNDLEGTRSAYERALEIFERSLPLEHPKNRDIREKIAKLDKE